MSTDSVQSVSARKKKIREGHKIHFGKLTSSVHHLLRDTDREENNAELFSRTLQLERKAQVISKLNEEILQEMQNENQLYMNRHHSNPDEFAFILCK